MTPSDVFEDANEFLTSEILSDPDFIKIRASGRSAGFLVSNDSVQISDGRFVKFALNPVAQDEGRGATKSRSGGLYQSIYDWLAYKKYGLTWSSDKERRGLAIAIVKKMSKEGSAKFRGDVAKTSIFPKAVDKTLLKLDNDLANFYLANTTRQIDSDLNIDISI